MCLPSNLTKLLLMTFSGRKKISNSMCFALACKTGLFDSETVLKSSCHRSVGVVNRTFSSVNKDWIHRTLAAVLAKLLYSASVFDLATRICFLDHQEMRLGPNAKARGRLYIIWVCSLTCMRECCNWQWRLETGRLQQQATMPGAF